MLARALYLKPLLRIAIGDWRAAWVPARIASEISSVMWPRERKAAPEVRLFRGVKKREARPPTSTPAPASCATKSSAG